MTTTPLPEQHRMQYRLLCADCAAIPLELTDVQQRVLAEQAGLTEEEVQRATEQIRDNKVPRWYVWDGFPESRKAQPPGEFPVHALAECESCDEELSAARDATPPAIARIPLTADQQRMLEEETGCDSLSLELGIDVLRACVSAQ